MSTNDYVKFVTQQVVSYMNSPKEARQEKKQLKRFERPPFLTRWFGVLPLSVALLYKAVKHRKAE
ncbi:YqzE family protein [Ectobacillus ponti]|uniref:YqzE family protein n=1 Tax=Ectobacillus ponti TaxID=2961894 RepID=A0AA41X180_9BACI|nr:YqzE family protein [Ectobacillus ponti]MCP8967094.1 YqzE family protein [Ectobacillus ponti]